MLEVEEGAPLGLKILGLRVITSYHCLGMIWLMSWWARPPLRPLQRS